MTMKGTMIAASVAGLFATLASGVASADHQKDGGQVICDGINACKGQGTCSGPGHACGGKNACKGQGHSRTTREECLKKGGKVVGEAK